MTGDATQTGQITRRRLVEGVGASALTAALAGCLGGGGGGSDPTATDGGGGSTDATTTQVPQRQIQLSGWTSNQEEKQLLSDLVGTFEESHDNVDVDYSPVESKYKQKLKTQLGAGNAPDVFYVDAKYFGSFASQGALLSLDSMVESGQIDTDAFFQPLLDAFRFDGTLYGVPKDFSTLGLYSNTALFEEAGANPEPATWSELRTSLQTVVDETDVKSGMIEYANARWWKALIYQNGGQIMSDDGSEAVFASDAGVEALQYMVDLKKDGLLSVPSELGADWHGQALGNGEVASAVIGPWAIPYLRGNHSEVNEATDVFHLPIPEGGEKGTAAYTVSYSVSANTSAPGAAQTLVSALTDSEGMARWAEKGVALSARPAHAELEFYQNNPRYRTHLEAGEWSHPVAYGAQSEAVINRLHPQLEGAMLEEKSPREALETAQSTINDEVLN
ncbi:ABC transporter substrate-binding protein [Salinirubrum litoreum]|uniref:ABC transporter substrate-binding protein n=1 Tax=Salinirubrum litoreum TaxID=1126234 RepID=A0ABD5RFR6_9EURY|nr:ABC transporter substrate-binding protein [Salinirubrum litoreum]